MSASKAIRRYRQVRSPASLLRMIHALSSSRRSSTSKSKRTTLGERLCHGDKGTRGQGDKETRGQGDVETRRQDVFLLVPLSPCPLVSLSSSPSLCPSVSLWLVRRFRSRN